jgi:aspartyl-tRNA(Asn)/glutamyl-tRNA(Gln) amidotransferase subunit C
MPVSGEYIERVAGPARPKLTSGELKKPVQDPARVIVYINLIQEVDTEGIIPQNHLIESGAILREGRADASFSAENTLSNAPDSDGGYFMVPGAIDK